MVDFECLGTVNDDDGASPDHFGEIESEGVFDSVALKVGLLDLDIPDTAPASENQVESGVVHLSLEHLEIMPGVAPPEFLGDGNDEGVSEDVLHMA